MRVAVTFKLLILINYSSAARPVGDERGAARRVHATAAADRRYGGGGYGSYGSYGSRRGNRGLSLLLIRALLRFIVNFYFIT